MATTRPMRSVLCTSGGLPGALVLGRLLRCPDLDVAGIVHSTRILRPEYGLLRGAWEQIRRSGPAYAVYLWCASSLADSLCALGGGRSVARRAAGCGIPMLRTRDVNSPDGRDFLARLEPDLLISAFFNQRLSLALLGLPRVAAVNIHPSLLPAFRGVDPVFHARLGGAARYGVTVHRLTPEFDAGDILIQAEVPVEPAWSILRTTALLYARGADMLADGLVTATARGAGTPQAHGGNYDSWPSRDQVRRLRAGGGALVRAADLMAILTAKIEQPPQPGTLRSLHINSKD